MTKAQTITIRLSECRQKINDLLLLDTRSEAQQTDLERLTGDIQKFEPELRAAIAAEPDPETRVDTVDAETRERIELRGRASLSGYLVAALAGRMPDGANAEYAAAHHAAPGHIPIDLWEADRPAAELRAATPAPTTGTGVSVAPIQPFVFAPSIAPRLGIDMPSVGSGGYSEMTISTALPAAAKAKGDNADDTAGALTPITANPRRISARMSVTVEDVAQIGQSNFEVNALRQNASRWKSPSDAYDAQIINGRWCTAPERQRARQPAR